MEISIEQLMGSTPMIKLSNIKYDKFCPETFSPFITFSAEINAEKIQDIRAFGLTEEMYALVGKEIFIQLAKNFELNGR
jgi:hypothetical protein